MSNTYLNFCPSTQYKALILLASYFADAVSFLLLVWFEVAANKNHKFFSGRAWDTGKFKKQGNFWLPRIQKECAPEFKTLTDYIIPCKNEKMTTLSW